MPKCLKCEKDLKFLTNCNNIGDAGYIEITFHYGSRHDQCLEFRRRSRPRRKNEDPPKPRTTREITRLERLLTSDKVQTYLCDDCFEKHQDLFEGYSVMVTDTKVV
jgi:hypothetical protein